MDFSFCSADEGGPLRLFVVYDTESAPEVMTMAKKRNITAPVENRTPVIRMANLLIGRSWLIFGIRKAFRVIKPNKHHI
jgi:hypothetical protein